MPSRCAARIMSALGATVPSRRTWWTRRTSPNIAGLWRAGGGAAAAAAGRAVAPEAGTVHATGREDPAMVVARRGLAPGAVPEPGDGDVPPLVLPPVPV